MRIAYISYEHPSDISGGGIGTYIGQISQLMANRGHEVEVFAATQGPANSKMIDKCLVHFIPAHQRLTFSERVLPVFAARHKKLPFALLESPEYGADGLAIKLAYPRLPLALRLHTPKFLIAGLNAYKRGYIDKLRYLAGAALRLKRVKLYWQYEKTADPEFEIFKLADGIASPSQSLARILGKRWGRNDIKIVPYPFTPANAKQPTAQPLATAPLLISFIGRLERRKGIFVLMKAIPGILKHFPDAVFQFVGEAVPSPRQGLPMDLYLMVKLKKYVARLRFTGLVPYPQVSTLIGQSDICIFPSLWENFPNVCLEAMSQGAAVIGTDNGGMADMIQHGINGLLIPPGSPAAIIQAVEQLGNDRKQLARLGEQARYTVLHNYNGARVGELTEMFYQETIAACKP